MDSSPAGDLKRGGRDILEGLVRDGQMTKKEKERIAVNMKEGHPAVFATVKIHKVGFPIRPIISSKGNVVSALLKWFAQRMNGYKRFCGFSVKDSVEFVNRLRKEKFQGRTIMTGLDVVSMFTNLKWKHIKEAVKFFYDKDTSIAGLSWINIEKILELIKKSSYHEKDLYTQVDGLPMGGAASPILAELTMGFFEEMFVKGRTDNLVDYCRYVDDVFVIWKGTSRQLDSVVQGLNEQWEGLRFEVQKEQDEQLNFLDVLIKKHKGQFATTVYRKETFTGRTLDFLSEHPRHMKRNVAFNFFMRARKLCSTEELLKKEKDYIMLILRTNHYPEKVIQETWESSERDEKIR